MCWFFDVVMFECNIKLKSIQSVKHVHLKLETFVPLKQKSSSVMNHSNVLYSKCGIINCTNVHKIMQEIA